MTDEPGQYPAMPAGPSGDAYGPQSQQPQPGYPPPQYGYPPPQYPPPQYGYPPAGYQQYPPQNSGTNGFAIASMVLGIVWLYWIGSVLAIIFGFVARSQIRRTGQGGDGMAIAGIVLGFVGVIAAIVFIIWAIAVVHDVNHLRDNFNFPTPAN